MISGHFHAKYESRVHSLNCERVKVSSVEMDNYNCKSLLCRLLMLASHHSIFKGVTLLKFQAKEVFFASHFYQEWYFFGTIHGFFPLSTDEICLVKFPLTELL